MSRQLALPFPVPQTYDPVDFMVSNSSSQAHSWLVRWHDWPASALILCGPAGIGKTHLAHVWASYTGAQFIDLQKLGKYDLGSLQSHPKIIIDGIDDQLSGEQQKSLLHLYNWTYQAKGALLLISRLPLGLWNITLPDLSSRLKSCTMIQMGAPDDEVLRAIIIKRLGEHQLNTNARLIDYILVHAPRQPHIICEIIDQLADYSLNGRSVGVPSAREIIKRFASVDE